MAHFMELVLVISLLAVSIRVSHQVCSDNEKVTLDACLSTMKTALSTEIANMAGDHNNADTYCSNMVLDSDAAGSCAQAVTQSNADCTDYGGQISTAAESVLQKIADLCSCSNLGTKLTALNTCINNINLPGTYNHDNLCIYVDAYIACVVTAEAGCQAMVYASRVGDIKGAADIYDCSITVDSNTYKTDVCSFREMTKCYDPLIKAAFWYYPDGFSSTQDWSTFYASAVYLSESAGLSCSSVDWNEMYECSNKEYKKCHRTTFKALLDGMGVGAWGTWRQTQADPTDLSALSTGLFDRLDSSLTLAEVSIAGLLQTAGGKLAISCMTSCNHYEADVTSYASCYAALGVTSETDLIQTIAAKYTNGQDYSADCTKLQGVTTCAENYLKGCEWNEWVLSLSYAAPVPYSVVDICDAPASFDLHNAIGYCDNEQFQDNDYYFTKDRCLPTHMSSTDLTDTLTDSTVCSAFQEQINCYIQNAWCCGTRSKLMNSMRHTWAMMNQLYAGGCNLKMEYDNETATSIPVQTNENSCDYNDVFTCYEPLLSINSMTASDFASVTRTELASLVSIKEMIEKDTALCPTDSQFETIVSCLNTFRSQCTFPKTCRGSYSTGHPLGELFFDDIMAICAAGCKTTPDLEDTLKACDVEALDLYSLNAMWAKMSGDDAVEEEACRNMSSFSDCAIEGFTECDYKKETFSNARVGLAGVLYDSAEYVCGVDLGQIEASVGVTAAASSAAIVTFSLLGFITSNLLM